MKADPKATHVVKAYPHTAPILSCRFDPAAENVFASAEDRTVVRWNLKTGVKQTVATQNGWIQSFGFLDGGATLVTAGTDGKLNWWNAKADKPTAIRSVQAHAGWARCLSVSKDGKSIATGGNDGLTRIWSADGKLIRTLTGHELRVYSVLFAPDGTLWSGDLHGFVKHWDVSTGKEIAGWRAKELHSFNTGQYVDYGGIRTLTLSPDGKNIACGGLYKASNPLGAVMEPLIQIYEIASGKLLKSLTAPSLNGTIWRAVWHPEGFIASGSGGNFYGYVVFWMADQEKDLARIQIPGLIRDLDIHPDGIQIVTSHYDRNVRILSMTAEPKKKA